MNDQQLTFRWPSEGQGALFDGNDYYQQHRDIPYLSPELLSDDALGEDWRRPVEWNTNTWSANG